MAWEVEYTDEFGQWWDTLSAHEQVEINAKVILLQERGPVLPRPHSDVIVTSKHSNMKELRGSVGEAELRVLYAFDPKRSAILLIGGDKQGNKKWYEEFVPIADKLFDKHLEKLEKERRQNVAKKFKDLQAKMSPEARRASEEKAALYSKEMALDELRTARRITQESLAKVLGVKQSAISKIERRADMYVSTLESVIEAMGGRLEIEAVFPDGKVKINQEVRKKKLARAV